MTTTDTKAILPLVAPVAAMSTKPNPEGTAPAGTVSVTPLKEPLPSVVTGVGEVDGVVPVGGGVVGEKSWKVTVSEASKPNPSRFVVPPPPPRATVVGLAIKASAPAPPNPAPPMTTVNWTLWPMEVVCDRPSTPTMKVPGNSVDGTLRVSVAVVKDGFTVVVVRAGLKVPSNEPRTSGGPKYVSVTVSLKPLKNVAVTVAVWSAPAGSMKNEPGLMLST